MSFRIHGVPDFHFDAIADGTSDILTKEDEYGAATPCPKPEKRTTPPHSISLG